jgi:glyoxylase-like metal-dependent hydrolase (beta-lactamase superfamily II)
MQKLVMPLLAVTLGCSFAGLTGEDVNQEVRANGLPARATVLEIWETGVTVNDDPVVGFRLLVEAEGRPSWQAETRNLVSLLAIPQIQPGSVLPVRFDPADPSRVAIVVDDEPATGGVDDPPDGPVQLGDDLAVEPIADGVWLHTSYLEVEPWGRTPANGIVVVSGSEAALIDTPWTDEQTGRLMAWAAVHLDATVSTVVATHSHQDCAGGLGAAHRAGASTYGLMRTAELAAARGDVAPRVRFEERLDILLGERLLELRYVGPGHTEDTLVVWLPDVGLLFGGCLVRSANGTSLGYTAEADLVRWPATIETLQRRYGQARLIVAGHGRPGGNELLTHTLELLRRHGDSQDAAGGGSTMAD